MLARGHGTKSRALARTKRRDSSIKLPALKRQARPTRPLLALNDPRWWVEVSLRGIVVLDKSRANRRHCARLWRSGAAALLGRLRIGRCGAPATRALSDALGRSLEIPAKYAQERALALQMEPRVLCYFGPDRYRRGVWLQRDAGQAWLKMRGAAANDGLPLEVISAFRSFYYQANLLARKRQRGEALRAILSVSAAPGYSEHHSGCALDFAEIGAPALTEEFADTRSSAWLQENAQRFGFVMSFPPDNRHGVLYEPWHWCYRPRDTASSASRQRLKKGSHR